jgi:hypothetical protein
MMMMMEKRMTVMWNQLTRHKTIIFKFKKNHRREREERKEGRKKENTVQRILFYVLLRILYDISQSVHHRYTIWMDGWKESTAIPCMSDLLYLI